MRAAAFHWYNSSLGTGKIRNCKEFQKKERLDLIAASVVSKLGLSWIVDSGKGALPGTRLSQSISVQEKDECPGPITYLSFLLSLLSTSSKKRGCTGGRTHTDGVEVVFRHGRQSLTAHLHLHLHLRLGEAIYAHAASKMKTNERIYLMQCLNETHQGEPTSCFQPVLLLVSRPGPAHARGSWQIQTPLTSCGCASMQRESTRDKMAGCSSRGTCLPAAARRARPCHLEAITCGCPFLTHVCRVQLTCSFCSFQLKVVREATLGKGSLKRLISVCNMWVSTSTPQQSLISPGYLYSSKQKEGHQGFFREEMQF